VIEAETSNCLVFTNCFVCGDCRFCDVVSRTNALYVITATAAHYASVITVLDEADEMLNMGFADDIEEIFSRLVAVNLVIPILS
jgi:superfamily II DNA/RNA helicase